MEEKTVNIPNISCGHCVATIRRELEEVEGVEDFRGDPESRQVTVRFTTPATWQALTELLTEIGYPAQG